MQSWYFGKRFWFIILRGVPMKLLLMIALISTIGIGEAMADKKYVKPNAEEIKKKLTPLEYEVTQKEGTERPFGNEYWDNKKDGIYVDKVTGEPLFSSLEKYDSGTGWPSFTDAAVAENVGLRESRVRKFAVKPAIRTWGMCLMMDRNQRAFDIA